LKHIAHFNCLLLVKSLGSIFKFQESVGLNNDYKFQNKNP